MRATRPGRRPINRLMLGLHRIHVFEALDDEVRASLAQRLALVSAVDADNSTEAGPPASFDTRQSILEQDRARRLHVEAPCGFEKKPRIWLAREPKFLRIKTIDTGIDQMIKSGSAQNGSTVLAG